MIEEGMPALLRRPLLFLFGEKLSREEKQLFRRIEHLRADVARRRGEPFALRPDAKKNDDIATPPNAPLELAKRSAKWVAYVASIPRYWGAFLHLCANAQRARIILELGSCAGISGSYLAAGRFCERFITIDGARDAADLAESNLRQVSERFQVVNALFDEGLDKVLPTLSGKIDLAYIDGDHEKDPTLNYFQRLIPYLNPGALVVFDDIRWTDGMWQAWQILSQSQGVSHSINLGRFGLCVWAGGNVTPKCFDLSIFTRDWRKGLPKEADPFTRRVRGIFV